MQLSIVRKADADEKIVCRADAFILSERTNGEFINSIRYLSYHPEGRFVDDSIIVLNAGNQEVCGVMMAAQDPDNTGTVISHPGTTFSGPILDHKSGVKTNFEVLRAMLDYYESRYQTVELRLRPTLYDTQPMEYIPYFLLNRGYQFNMTALANILRIDKAEDPLTLYTASRRNQVRKAAKEDQYVFNQEAEIREEYWMHMSENLRSKYGVKPTHTFAEIRHLSRICLERIHAFSMRRRTGEYGAFALVYRFKNVFHTQYLDLNYDYSSEYPHLLLIQRLIQLARQEGFVYFSFGASTEERGKCLNIGLYRYKEEYGGGSIVLPVYTKRKDIDAEELRMVK